VYATGRARKTPPRVSIRAGDFLASQQALPRCRPFRTRQTHRPIPRGQSRWWCPFLGVGENPVTLGLVASFARPGGNATGINYFNQEVDAKRLGLLHRLVPSAVRVAVLVNPANATNAVTTLREVQEAARSIGLQSHVLNASTSREIDAAFATLARERPDALFVAAESFFLSRRVQFVNLAARERIPAAYGQR
jgi:ABC-type uncharacterized transport system substrate-binding protein